jgi:hypothetical protein
VGVQRIEERTAAEVDRQHCRDAQGVPVPCDAPVVDDEHSAAGVTRLLHDVSVEARKARVDDESREGASRAKARS